MKKSVMTAFFIGAVFLSGCSGDKENSVNFFAMDTLMTVRGYGEETGLKKAEERVKELEEKLSPQKEGSDIYLINHSGGNAVTVSEDTLFVLEKACEYSALTNGSLDITMYPISEEWGFFSEEKKVPESEKIKNLLEKTGFENTLINENSVCIPEGFALDTGAAAKGYAADQAAKVLKENGISSAVIDLGGNIRVLGEKPDGSPWKVAVADPFSPNEYFCVLSVKDCSVVTSGDYQRYFIAPDGKKYCHILDPKTGYPAESGIASATVIGQDGLACDLLSTAVFVMGISAAEELYRTSDGFEMVIAASDGELFVTEGIKDSFLLSDNKKSFTVIEK